MVSAAVAFDAYLGWPSILTPSCHKAVTSMLTVFHALAFRTVEMLADGNRSA